MKKIVSIISILVILVLVIILIKNINKIEKNGNNISNKSTLELQNYILNIKSYDAIAEVTIKSNKNVNTYKLKQKYSENVFMQEVIEPENISGTKIIYNGEKLEVNNTRLNLSKIYENYKYISNNNLCLNYFIEDYKATNNSCYKEENGQVILETQIKNENNYFAKKCLYVDKNSGNPIKMEIEDKAQNILVYILYTEIKINSLQKNDILAFKNQLIQIDI